MSKEAILAGGLERAAFTIDVPTTSRDYKVYIGEGLLNDVGRVTTGITSASQAVVIADSTVAGLYGARTCSSLEEAGLPARLVTFPAGEAHKRFSYLEKLLEALADAGLTRDDVVIALGGGVTGDMGGLAAALYLRGIAVIQVPTSLLAMVDSSVGGKTAVDLAAGKNLAGCFWQPRAVVADVTSLDTLTPELFQDSIGEIVKHAVLADPALFEELCGSPLTQQADHARLARVICRNIEIKRDVVVADERESGLRQKLNLGHTIGHAVEAASAFSLGHGSCVAIGLCCIARASAGMGWCTPETAARIEQCVAVQGLPTDTELSHEAICRYAFHDKKRHGDGVNLVIIREIGKVQIRRVTLEEFSHVVEMGCGTSQKGAKV